MLKPLDSLSEPKDVAIIKNHGDGHKTVVRQSFNYKHSYWHQDTIAVKEVSIFRKRINIY